MKDQTFHNDKHNFYREYETWDMYSKKFNSMTSMKQALPYIEKIHRKIKDNTRRSADYDVR